MSPKAFFIIVFHPGNFVKWRHGMYRCACCFVQCFSQDQNFSIRALLSLHGYPTNNGIASGTPFLSIGNTLCMAELKQMHNTLYFLDEFFHLENFSVYKAW